MDAPAVPTGISPDIAALLDETRTPAAEQKIAVLMPRLQGAPLAAADCAAMQAYILAPRPDNIPVSRWPWVVNDILRLQCAQPVCPAGLVATVYALYEDEDRGPILREYAVQHMGVLHTPAPGSVVSITAAERERLTATLARLARDGKSRFCGAALNALANVADTNAYNREHDIAEPIAPAPAVDLAAIARAVALDDTALSENRATALGVCGQLHDDAPLDTARTLARDPQTPLSLRMASIYLVSIAGGATDREWLEPIAADTQSFPLNKTAEAALKKLPRI
ncbi:hypothetical protein OH491_07335 [Termitidicoccus mucosus]|uniref:PBS lyase n=1 Tax=Termitidicoccus mucosus TaxID=1184151 RepID=A0A178IQT1_9BACT|nr:hypothetical protein AW736_26515 [Opitutaceae bacterium TSB47]